MAVEAKRGCGFRKVGGLYLVGDRLGAPCCKLPIELKVCPICGGGVKQTRGWTWIDPRPWLKGACKESVAYALMCPAANGNKLGEKIGLLWIGTQFYPTSDHFAHEANTQGISRRITAVPRGWRFGQYVALAHPKVMIEGQRKPGIFRLFRPTAIEKIVTETESKDEAAMQALADKGITPFAVPDDDKDHRGTVYDDDTTDELQLEKVDG